MKITVANIKGGVGKTTTAMFLAAGLARDGRTLLVDADPKGSALRWFVQAGDLPFPLIAWPVRDLARRVTQIAEDYQHLVIDTGPEVRPIDPSILNRPSTSMNSVEVYWANSTGRRNTLISEVLMGRPVGWITGLTGRPAMRSPGAPALPRELERVFWRARSVRLG